MLNLKQILTMHCREVTQLTSDEFDRRLTWSERIGMRLHVGFCGNCRRLRRQLVLLNQWAKQLLDSVDSPDEASARLSDRRRELIKSAMRNV